MNLTPRIVLAAALLVPLLTSAASAQFHVSMNSLLMTRSSPNSATLLSNGATAPSNAGAFFTAQQFDFDWKPGVEMTASTQLTDAWAFEGRYFWLDDFTATHVNRTVKPAGTADFFGATFTDVVGGTTTRGYFLTYQSDIQGAEANSRLELNDWLTFINGFRWLEIDEQLHGAFRSTPSVGPVDDVFKTQNDLWGGQLGFDVLLVERESIEVNLLAKTGAFGNFARGSALDLFPTPGFNSQAFDTNTVAAFVGELRLDTTIWLTSNWGIHTGYNVLLVDGIALASNQPWATGNLATTTPTAPMQVNTNDTVIYQGGFLGFFGEF
ncbi:MAG: hypothetical protein RIC55_28280 [Pirellulaceae bacterium]